MQVRYVLGQELCAMWQHMLGDLVQAQGQRKLQGSVSNTTGPALEVSEVWNAPGHCQAAQVC